MKHNHTLDPHAEKMGKGKVGIVGESHIWDGPLSQVGWTNYSKSKIIKIKI